MLVLNIASQQPYESKLLLITLTNHEHDESVAVKLLDMPEKGRNVTNTTFIIPNKLKVVYSTDDTMSTMLAQYDINNNTTAITSKVISSTIENWTTKQLSFLQSLSISQFLVCNGKETTLTKMDNYFYKMIFKPIGGYSSGIMESSIIEPCAAYFPSLLLQKCTSGNDYVAACVLKL